MPLLVNLRHLDEDNVRLEGELELDELDIDTRDDMLRLAGPLKYGLDVQKMEGGLLVQGELSVPLQCQCVRCLKVFEQPLQLPCWTVLVPLEGEEAAAVVSDCVDLTPLVREDILLEFPQHPLCDADCRGLPKGHFGTDNSSSSSGQPEAGSPAWNELNKLKF